MSLYVCKKNISQTLRVNNSRILSIKNLSEVPKDWNDQNKKTSEKESPCSLSLLLNVHLTIGSFLPLYVTPWWSGYFTACPTRDSGFVQVRIRLGDCCGLYWQKLSAMFPVEDKSYALFYLNIPWSTSLPVFLSFSYWKMRRNLLLFHCFVSTLSQS